MGTYSAELAKGQGSIPEILTLLEHWEPGMSSQTLAKMTVEQGLLARSSAMRAKDLATVVFARRLLADDGRPAADLKYLMERGADRALVRQLILLFTARRQAVIRDYVVDVYWPRAATGAMTIGREEVDDFLEDAVGDGRISPRWSESMTERIAGGLNGTLADFGLLEDQRKSTRAIRPYAILNGTALYLAHEVHFKGYNDTSILESPDWKLFGLDRPAVLKRLEQASQGGHFIMQYAGDLLRIAWRYDSMQDCLDGIARL